MNNFIKLKRASDNATIEINPMFIESMELIELIEEGNEPYTLIYTFSGREYGVKETSKMIEELMRTKKITYFNQGQ